MEEFSRNKMKQILRRILQLHIPYVPYKPKPEDPRQPLEPDSATEDMPLEPDSATEDMPKPEIDVLKDGDLDVLDVDDVVVFEGKAAGRDRSQVRTVTKEKEIEVFTIYYSMVKSNRLAEDFHARYRSSFSWPDNDSSARHHTKRDDKSEEDKSQGYLNSKFIQRQQKYIDPKTGAITVIVCSSTSQMIPQKLYSGRVDLFVGDTELLKSDYRCALGIQGALVASSTLSIPQKPENEPQITVALQLIGENKEYWDHSRTADGKIVFYEMKRLYLGSLVAKLQSTGRCLPLSALWDLSTTDGLPHDLQARVLINDVTDSSQERHLLTLETEVAVN